MHFSEFVSVQEAVSLARLVIWRVDFHVNYPPRVVVPCLHRYSREGTIARGAG
jgi:hypothetical protein